MRQECDSALIPFGICLVRRFGLGRSANVALGCRLPRHGRWLFCECGCSMRQIALLRDIENLLPSKSVPDETSRSQEQLRMHPHGVVRVYVFELNHATRRYQEHRRHGKLVMLLSRNCFQIDSVLCKKLQSGVIHLIGDPESS